MCGIHFLIVMTYVVVDFLESIVRECGHGVGCVSVPHADGVVDGLQHTSQTVHIYLRGHWLEVDTRREFDYISTLVYMYVQTYYKNILLLLLPNTLQHGKVWSLS